MKLFDLDSPLMRVLGKVADLVIINLLTLLLCIPVITAGAAFTAMHYCVLKLARDRETGVLRMFFHSFKDNLKQSTAIWLMFLVFLAFIGYDIVAMNANPMPMSTFIFGGLMFFVIMALWIGCWVFTLQARFANTIRGTLKTAFILSFRYFYWTVIMLAAKIFPFALFFIGNIGLMIFPIILAFCFSFPAFIAAKLYDKPFKKLEDAYYAAHPIEEDINEEKIFNDVPDENA